MVLSRGAKKCTKNSMYPETGTQREFKYVPSNSQTHASEVDWQGQSEKMCAAGSVDKARSRSSASGIQDEIRMSLCESALARKNSWAAPSQARSSSGHP